MMKDEHEYPALDLPELNAQKIDENRYTLMQLKISFVGLCTFMVVLTAGTYIVAQHSLEECENRLHKKLMEKAK